MLQVSSVAKIFLEVDELITIVTFGAERLKDFTCHLGNLEDGVFKLNTKDSLEDIVGQYKRLQASIQSTKQSIDEWIDKAYNYQHILRKIHEDDTLLRELASLDLRAITKKVLHLVKLLTEQKQVVEQHDNRLVHLSDILLEKKKLFQPHFERGVTPHLTDTAHSSLEDLILEN